MIIHADPDPAFVAQYSNKLREQPTPKAPQAALDVATVLAGAQQAFRENGFLDAVVELRESFDTELGKRFSAYLTNSDQVFEQSLFSMYIPSDESRSVTFVEGETHTSVSRGGEAELAKRILSLPHVLSLVTGLLRQFSRQK